MGGYVGVVPVNPASVDTHEESAKQPTPLPLPVTQQNGVDPVQLQPLTLFETGPLSHEVMPFLHDVSPFFIQQVLSVQPVSYGAEVAPTIMLHEPGDVEKIIVVGAGVIVEPVGDPVGADDGACVGLVEG